MADDAASPSASTSPDAALTSVQDLQAGDCFLPSSTEAQTSATEPASPQPQDSSAPAQVPSQIDLVTVVTCSQPHLYEVLSVTRLSEAALPELSALREQASVACQEAVSPYLENQTEHPNLPGPVPLPHPDLMEGRGPHPPVPADLLRLHRADRSGHALRLAT